MQGQRVIPQARLVLGDGVGQGVDEQRRQIAYLFPALPNRRHLPFGDLATGQQDAAMRKTARHPLILDEIAYAVLQLRAFAMDTLHTNSALQRPGNYP